MVSLKEITKKKQILFFFYFGIWIHDEKVAIHRLLMEATLKGDSWPNVSEEETTAGEIIWFIKGHRKMKWPNQNENHMDRDAKFWLETPGGNAF